MYSHRFGAVIDVTLVMDKITGNTRGFGFVTFENKVCSLAHAEREGCSGPTVHDSGGSVT